VSVPGPSMVLAAGAVCWRVVADRHGVEEVRVLLVHRAARADTGIPKGKVDPGEMPPQAAVREIKEETGLSIVLGAPLGTTEYTMPGGREKIVHYWSAEVPTEALAETTFTPSAEIASVEWMTIPAARTALSFEQDGEILDSFAARIAAGTARTFPIIALRHGKAVSPSAWDGPDATRPLLHRGLEQARIIAPSLAAWAPTKLMSSTAVRCLTTIEPVAALLGLPVKTSATLSQDAYEDGTASVKKLIRKRLTRTQPVVICSHGPVIPQILDEVVAATNTPLDAATRRAGMLATAEFTVMHVSLEHPQNGLVAIETHSPALD
jgi:phosphohistidine phosphatase SixA/8-oxo-dGTP pyrophosphatase MutT (NUDIX family)